jgi:hypothetical protein
VDDTSLGEVFALADAHAAPADAVPRRLPVAEAVKDLRVLTGLVLTGLDQTGEHLVHGAAAGN